MDQAVRGRQEEDVGSMGNTTESKLSEWHVDFQFIRLGGRGCLDPLGEIREYFVEFSSSASVFLFLLYLVFVSVSRFPLFTTSLVEPDIGYFSVELDILSVSYSSIQREMVSSQMSSFCRA